MADDFDWYLLTGDETALPAIARRLDELPYGVPVIVIAAIDRAADRIALVERGDLRVTWVERGAGAGGDADRLRETLDRIALLEGEGFVWIACEAQVARAVRAHVIDALGHPRAWTKASGYWSSGEAGAHQRIEDE